MFVCAENWELSHWSPWTIVREAVMLVAQAVLTETLVIEHLRNSSQNNTQMMMVVRNRALQIPFLQFVLKGVVK